MNPNVLVLFKLPDVNIEVEIFEDGSVWFSDNVRLLSKSSIELLISIYNREKADSRIKNEGGIK